MGNGVRHQSDHQVESSHFHLHRLPSAATCVRKLHLSVKWGIVVCFY